MKSAATSKRLPADFPKTPAEWEALIAAAPGEDRPPTPEEESQWANAVVVHRGGPQAVRAALAQRRRRGPNKRPTKVPTTLRLPRDTLERWKATGPGWQTRMAEVLEKAV
ncbi:MAG: hypothetical protein JWQ90_4390 [Hydrocarboniphaga sp.]|uniref:BrnA antitoxin family protein n=1 Tax=Hydrocarboniphaga sp. TaxID=2033016 RepID=UPI00260770DD|nr:BrnA antitoxin family protein [Hydrocarboniphaga sp.]MDB5971940.1 hypothetical protein [Hydrocarboniphaga sp.]